ncbi:NAC domain-containing protein 16-like isoform X2 [Phalaenopsis equestris]|uniref:NAC domain-containing protein 16-like isoform X2 n=1 Tax=Phalaenopsis equestris TaxID=78828 RepID=UPI0009E4ED63|nr:NAC domain-containing protein 16-like isoform X2 [Phalaenopsis equestris]
MDEAFCSKARPKQPPPQPVEASTQLAPGFRFHPTDEELVSYYLKRKVSGKPIRVDAISEIDLYKAEPWDLPPLSRLRSRDLEWYFFTSLDRKYSNRCRTNRATIEGFWKTTGKDRPIQRRSRTIGMKKTLVYHAGRAPHGQRTNWVMHEYRLEDEDLTRSGIPQDGYVVCRIFQKNGPGPQNGAQYGAPFIEEEWEMEEEEDAKRVPVDVDRDYALVDHAGQDFVELEDFFQNPDSGYQNLDAFPSESRSAEHQFGSRTEDSSIFVDEILKTLDSLDDRIPGADCSAPQFINTPLNRLGEMEGREDQSIFASLQSNGYMQLEDIFVEGNPNPSSDACSNYCLWDTGNNNNSVVNDISPSKSLFRKPAEEESCYTNCSTSMDQLQLSQTVQHDMFPQSLDPSDTVLWEYPSGQLAEDNSIFYDALNHELAYSEGGFALETSLAPLADFELSEDLMAYYDASDDNLIYGSPNLLSSKFEQANSLECIEPNDSLEVVGSTNSSYKEVLHEKLVLQSSSGKPQTGDGFSSGLNDAKLKDPQDKTLTKRLALGICQT